MKILSSELSMEATKGHTDVTRLAVSQNSGISSGFILDLPDRFAGSAFSYQAGLSSTSAIENSAEDGNGVCTITEQSRLAKVLVETITGTEAEVTAANPSTDTSSMSTRMNRPATRYYRVGNQPFQVSLGVVSTRIETESLQVSSSGSLKTADGRSIDFSLDLSMESREISRTMTGLSGGGGLLIDPIVLNFESGLDMLQDGFTFSFDLDCDGEKENICSLTRGSGFLALDKNSDAQINDGSELFGPLTGSGYGELAEYDADNNNWIDENDPIFDQLLVWVGGGSDDSQLMSLKEAGVGAISLARVSGGQFSLKNEQGQVMATVDSSGLFLTEDGAVHSMQELDLLVQEKKPAGEGYEPASSSLSLDLVSVLKEKLRRHRSNMVAALHRTEHDDLAAAKRESWLQKRFWQWNERNREENLIG